MNKADNAAGTKAVDSLINFETVKVTLLYVFNNLIYVYSNIFTSISIMNNMKQINMINPWPFMKKHLLKQPLPLPCLTSHKILSSVLQSLQWC